MDALVTLTLDCFFLYVIYWVEAILAGLCCSTCDLWLCEESALLRIGKTSVEHSLMGGQI